MDFDDDIFRPPAAAAMRVPGKFRPKARPKAAKPAQAPAEPQPVAEPPTSAPVDGPSIETSDVGTANAEPVAGEVNVADMSSVECIDLNRDLTTTGRTDGGIQPEGKLGSKDDKLVTNHGGVQSDIGSSRGLSSVTMEVLTSELHINQEPNWLSDETMVQAGISVDGAHVSENDTILPSEPEGTTLMLDLGSLDDGLCSSATSVKEADKFQPKLIPDFAETDVHPVDTDVYFSQTWGTESGKSACSTTEMEPSFLQMLGKESLDDTPLSSFNISDHSGDVTTGHGIAEDDITEIPGLETLENVPYKPVSTLGLSAGEFQAKLNARTNVKPNSYVTSHGVIESFNTQTDPYHTESECLEGHVPTFSPISIDSATVWTCDATTTDLIKEQAYHVDTCTHEVASPRNDHDGRETTQPVSKDTNEEVPFQDAELTQKILNEKSTSRTAEDEGARKSSRKFRKQIDLCSPVDIAQDDMDSDNTNTSQIEEAHNDDEYRGEEVPKQKRIRRKPKKQMTENEKPTQKHKRAPKNPSSTEHQPTKKNFPHGTKRKRRQVNKVLLETPEDEIDPKQLSIKDLIMLAEAKERIQNKESAELRRSSSNQSNSAFPNDSHFDTDDRFETDGQYNDYDGVEENSNVQFSSTKWNYHSFMKKPTSTRWSKLETEKFYQAIRQFGTDFAMIQKLFPGRSRHQMKLKFKNEERKHPMQVSDALIHRSKDNSHFELVIQKLAEEEKERANKEETYYDPYAESPDEVGENENQDESEHAEKQEVNGWDGGHQSSVKFDEEGEIKNPNQFNEYEDDFRWDASASSPQNTGKDEYDDFLV